MNEQQMHQILYKQVAIACESLELNELAALYLNTILNNSANVQVVAGYDKISYLFEDGKMHGETKRVFVAYCEERLNS